MKAIKILASIAILFAVATMSTYAQGNGQGKGMRGDGSGFDNGGGREMCLDLPNLTDVQKEKMDKLRIAQIDKMTDFRNKKDELKAKYRTLSTADEPDMKAINSLIDEMTGIENQMLKLKAIHHQEIRALLTADQRVMFDAQSGKGKHGKKMGKGMGKGKM